MKKVNLLSRAEMKKISGGLVEAGRCVMCTCHSGGTTCWYSKRSSHDLCAAVCGSDYFNALDGIDCDGCTMN